MATRVIAGVAGGRRLAVPAGRATRPTSDRTREGLFATVGSVLGSMDGLRVLDLYAGSGAVGLEAASRGAVHVLLVESAPAALRVIRRNVQHTALPGIEVAGQRVESVLAQRPATPYDFVFADPPYATADDVIATLLETLYTGGWLAAGALVAIERESRGTPVAWPAGYVPDRARRYGDATLWYGRAA